MIWEGTASPLLGAHVARYQRGKHRRQREREEWGGGVKRTSTIVNVSWRAAGAPTLIPNP